MAARRRARMEIGYGSVARLGRGEADGNCLRLCGENAMW